MNPIIFLDFDGVLNSLAYARAHFERTGTPFGIIDIDRDAVARLNTLIERTGAEVVVSSSWRLGHSWDELSEILRAKGFKGRVIGVTPSHHRQVQGSVLVVSSARRDEIKAWIEEHTFQGPFVVFDDDSDASIEGHFIKTAWEDGLQDRHVEAAAEILLSCKFEHSDPCCHKWGCKCRLGVDEECKVCKLKIERA